MMSMLHRSRNDSIGAVERLLAVVKGEIPDRVPVYPMIDSLPAHALGVSIKEYYATASTVLRGQALLQERLDLEYVLSFFYLAMETELFGMQTTFFDNASPNAGRPIVDSTDFFASNDVPELHGNPIYEKTLALTRGLAERYKGKKPVLAVQTGPFSFPAMLMGASGWFEALLLQDEQAIARVLEFSRDFGIQWARGHVEAGADAIVFVDGLATATGIPPDMFEARALPAIKAFVSAVKAPCVFYTAGGDLVPIAGQIGQAGVVGAFPSANDDLAAFKRGCNNAIVTFGNLNNLELGDWTDAFMQETIAAAMDAGKPGGKFILATQHMIPHDVGLDRVARLIDVAMERSWYS